MPKKRKQQLVTGQHFAWLMGRRGDVGVFYADGRSSNRINVGRHSLGTKDEKEALNELRQLDLTMAVKHGLIDKSALEMRIEKMLSIDHGVDSYMDHLRRPRIMGGASPRTVKRYKAILDKFKKFLSQRGVRFWQEVNIRVFEAYGRWLAEEEYAERTKGTELTTVKQAINCLVRANLLPQSCKFTYPVKKIRGSTTYCYRDDELAAMVAHCAVKERLHWLRDIIVALAYTGLRISELAQLRWSAVDRDNNMLRVVDNSRLIREGSRIAVTSTKSQIGRSLPIHFELQKILESIPHHSDGRVFHGPRGGGVKPDVVRVVLIRDVLKPLAPRFPARADEPSLIDGRVHSFRHYFCSLCARTEGGPKEQTLMEWLGHQDSSMIRHYFHLHDDDAQRQMSKVKPLTAPDAA